MPLGGNMRKLTKNEMLNLYGGGTITGAFLSSLIKGINTILELGRSLGSAIRRGTGGRMCSIS